MSTEIQQDLTGQTIKGYELRERIGQGGFGAVYRAYQASVDREVAVKVILPQHANDPDFIRRFETEAQVIARLEHLHIIPLYDYWREPDRAWLIMRLLKGGSLQDSIEKNGAWGLTETAHLLDQIADALDTAHRQQIIHRDLKPANILLDENNNAYLADFGIAKKLTGEQQVVREEDRYGSPAFISPEQVIGQAVSPQTDIYSLGMVLYVTLTGHTPFFDTSTGTLIRKQLSESLPPLQNLRPNLPYAINVIIWRATSKRPEARYPNALSLASDFRHAIAPDSIRGMVASQLSAPPVSPIFKSASEGQTVILEPLPSTNNPYKGLRAFQEADSADFFGRTALIDRLVARLADPDHVTNFLAVVGPSGSGKSSVVLAGLIPALKRGALHGSQDWYYVHMTPGANPLQELADVLLSVSVANPSSFAKLFGTADTALAELIPQILPETDAILVLTIDQFEEVFTLLNNERQRAHFLQLLTVAVNAVPDRFRLILTLRADFYDRPLLYPGFSTLMRDHSEIVLPLSASEMEQAIVGPASRIGIQFEPGLASQLTGEVSQQPGALPLLQFTLTELFEHRENYRLTYEAYREIGGVRRALAKRADELYESLTAAEQGAARQIFLRLVTIGEGNNDTRRRAPRTELNHITSDKNVLQTVIDAFGKHRLLTFDFEPGTRAPTVEIAHESLIQVWSRLRDWLDASREELRIYRRLNAAAADWINGEKDGGFLASGSRLAQFEQLQNSAVLSLTREETDYLHASINLRKRNEAKSRNVIVGLVVLTVFALALAIVAFDRQRVATEEEQRADLQASISRSRELAITAQTGVDRFDLSLLLSLEALNAANTFEARNSLMTGLQSQPSLLRFLEGHTDAVRTVAYSPDGKLLASAGRDNTIRLWDIATNQTAMPPLKGHTDWINSLVFNTDGTIVYSASADGTVRRWATATGTQIGEPIQVSQQEVWSLAYNPEKAEFATGDAQGQVKIWNAATGKQEGNSIAAHTDIVYALTYSPDGQLLASGGGDGLVRLWNTATYEPQSEALEDDNSFVLNLAFSPDSKLLISTGVNAVVDFWDIATNEFLYSISTGHGSRIKGLAFSPDGQKIATSSDDHTIQLWDATTKEQIGPRLTGHLDAVWAVTFSPDGSRLASASSDQKVIIWDASLGQPLVHSTLTNPDDILTLAYSPDGSKIAYAGGLKNEQDNRIHIVDSQTYTETLTLAGHTSYVTGISFSPDSNHLASVSPDQTLRVWELATGSLVFTQSLNDINPFAPVAISPDGTMIATGNENGTISLWEFRTGAKIGKPLAGHTAGVRALAFSPDNKLIASGGVDRLLIVHDLATNMPVAPPLPDYTDEIWSLDFSPDGKIIASGGTDQNVVIWDTLSSRPLGQPFEAHQDWVTGLAFSPNGELVASASHDGTIILWDLKEQRMLGNPLVGHSDFINVVSFSPDGTQLISGGEDQKLVVWDVDLSNWRERACAIANRNLSPQEWETYFEDVSYRQTCAVVASN